MSDIDWKSYRDQLTQAAIAGLDGVAPTFERAAEAAARARMRGQTGATFAGIFAAVDGAGVDSSGIVNAAVERASELNPAHVVTEAPETEAPAGVVRLLLSVPTDYIPQLEADPRRAFLARTLDEEQTAIANALDAALKGAL